jgi:hypothetical protein
MRFKALSDIGWWRELQGTQEPKTESVEQVRVGQENLADGKATDRELVRKTRAKKGNLDLNGRTDQRKSVRQADSGHRATTESRR